MREREGVREERTGLHELEFIEVRRHWFTDEAAHDTEGTVNVLNLVEGDEVEVASPTGAFAPYRIHYAETFIVPAAVGPYVIRRTARVAERALRDGQGVRAGHRARATTEQAPQHRARILAGRQLDILLTLPVAGNRTTAQRQPPYRSPRLVSARES